jgi:hypothetical protein
LHRKRMRSGMPTLTSSGAAPISLERKRVSIRWAESTLDFIFGPVGLTR